MLKQLTNDQRDTYLRDGIVFPIQVMDPSIASSYRRELENFENEFPSYMTGMKRQKLHVLTTWMADIIRKPKILDAVGDILGPNLLCWQTSLFIKNAKDPGFVSWHQDGNYWGLSNHEVVTAWLALSPSTMESGCMRMLPGSHAWDRVPHKDTFDKNNLLTRGQIIDMAIDESQSKYVIVQPGEISLHHVNIAHASSPNQSCQRRIGIAIRYVTPSVRQVTGVPDSATLVRGQDKIGNFELEPAPEYDFAPSAIKLHTRITNTRERFLFKN